ncbi:ribosomal RNA methyltransferase MRM2 [Ascosphaera apis ARSEF 7405]|uniref:rRNA methyltransferase 2, mitochondrial n=1 Tax=Ascosphaera apis ARSEF 7405 TaxID=392613 RepID=A0A162I828_9EURO|nr:ribosomal RNA methyltransferase MRM2 [Ascosphaera apis ARSEF 7405]
MNMNSLSTLSSLLSLSRQAFATSRSINLSPLCFSRRHASSSSSNRWRERQAADVFTREAAVRKYKSRAAFKLIQINDQHRIFRPGQSIVDLGFAPGSWSQVAAELTKPNGRVIGVDIIPAQPPRGVSTIQGNFLLPQIQQYVREYLRNPDRGRCRPQSTFTDEAGYLARERQVTIDEERYEEKHGKAEELSQGGGEGEGTVDVVLSDMWEPLPLTGNTWKRSFSNPFHRMMNTSGNKFRDHAGSMDLCLAALSFAYNTLKPGGHFICKFYQGSEDKSFEMRLKKLFQKVHREKPESSRSQSKESFFVALRRKGDVPRREIFPEEVAEEEEVD